MSGEVGRVITLTLPSSFAQLYDSVRHQHGGKDTINEPCLALDPGETTGVAEFDGDKTIRVYQQLTQHIGETGEWLSELLTYSPFVDGKHVHLRSEDYRVYEWKTDDHAWSPVHTIQLIGAIRLVAHQTSTPLTFAMASVAKKWWTDSKLDHFMLNPKGLRHGRDALRHLLYYILFPSEPK